MRKLTIHKAIRNSGFEIDTKRADKGTVNDQKLENNIQRARARIFELAYCNPWELFVTLTIDPKRHNRHDLNKYMRNLSRWITEYNRDYGQNIKYLLIPEMHKDGAWHLHGFLMGLNHNLLVKNKNGYLDWLEYQKEFGWISIDKIKNHEAVSKYVTKYISKNLQDCVKQLHAHMYYCSKGLQRAVEIKRGTLSAYNVPWTFENDWIKCFWSKIPADVLEHLIV